MLSAGTQKTQMSTRPLLPTWKQCRDTVYVSLTGGFAGVSNHAYFCLTSGEGMHQVRRGVASRVRLFRLDAAQIGKWRDYFASRQWRTAPPREDVSRPQPDHFHYTIDFQGKKIAWQDFDADVKAALPEGTFGMITDITGQT